MKYRPDLDGLRAVAVIGVVAFHAGVPGISGGFVGVDVFFVLSGFLITGILWRELMNTGRVSWSDFYARRARRLLPALAITVLLTLIAGAFVLVPDPEYRKLAQSAMAAMLFSANIFFYFQTTDYYATNAEHQPLLHTWSLAVEEQFYLVWPLLLVMAYFVGRRVGNRPVASAFGLLAVITFASFGGTVIAMEFLPTSMIFYGMLSRLWELSLGGLVALFLMAPDAERFASRTTWAVIGWIGLAITILSMTLMSESVPFPGWGALPVCVGTAMLILSGGLSQGLLSKILSTPVFTWMGRMSYGWYLFHWPPLVLVRIATGKADPLRDSLIGFGSVFAAWVMYKTVENPLRRGHVSLTRTIPRSLQFGAACCVTVVALASTAMAAAGPLTRWAEPWRTRVELPMVNECPHRPASDPNPIDCEINPGARPTFVLTGDSHSVALYPILRDMAYRDQFRLVVMWLPNCPMINPGAVPDEYHRVPECPGEVKARQQWLAANSKSVAGIIWTGFLSDQFRVGGESVDRQARARVWFNGLKETLEPLAKNSNVLIVHDVPAFPINVNECLSKGKEDCSMPSQTARKQRELAYQTERALISRIPNVTGYDVMDDLCSGEQCLVKDPDGKVMWMDDDHLTPAGAAVVGKRLDPFLQNWMKSARRS